MEKTVLILGGTGTLSKTIAEEAFHLGFAVSVFNRGNHNDFLPEPINKIKGDFYDENSLSSAFLDKHYDVVIDFLSRKKSDIQRVFPIFATKCKQYVFISSCCVFRRSIEDFPIVETSPKPNEDWKYNVEKFEAENKITQLSKELNSCNYTIVRPYITYDEHRIPIAVAPNYAFHQTIIERIKRGKPMFVIDDGLTVSTVTYIEDFAKGVIGLLNNPKAYNEDFNVVGDFRYTHREILETLYKKIGIEPNIISVPRNIIAKYLPNYSEMVLGDRALNAVFDNSKLKNVVPGIQFEYDLNKGLDKVLEYYEKDEISAIDYQYDGQIDYMLRKTAKISSHYSKYGSQCGLADYLLFSYFPYKLACKIKKWGKK